MPFKKQISEVEESIEATRAEIAKLRANGAGTGDPVAVAQVDRLLVELAKLRAERVRLLQNQIRISKLR